MHRIELGFDMLPIASGLLIASGSLEKFLLSLPSRSKEFIIELAHVNFSDVHLYSKTHTLIEDLLMNIDNLD